MEVNKEVLGKPIEESFLPEDNCSNEQTIKDLKLKIEAQRKQITILFDGLTHIRNEYRAYGKDMSPDVPWLVNDIIDRSNRYNC